MNRRVRTVDSGIWCLTVARDAMDFIAVCPESVQTEEILYVNAETAPAPKQMPSGFQTVIGKDRIFIKRSRKHYSAYTSETREPKNTPVPMNPPTTEQEKAVRDHDGSIVTGKTAQEVKDKLSKIRAFELES